MTSCKNASSGGSGAPNIWMSDHEVTQKEWKDVMGNDGNSTTTLLNSGIDYGKGDNYPMYYVSWYDALVYCNKRSINEGRTLCYTINGKINPADWGPVPTTDNDATWDAVTCNFNANGYRLPTEAEWEYMAKGGENYTYSGSNDIDTVGWYGTNNAGKVNEVKKKLPNGYGMYDMSGNVYEWCWDWDSYNSTVNTERVARGGSFIDAADNCAVSDKLGSLSPGKRNHNYGFRVVHSK